MAPVVKWLIGLFFGAIVVFFLAVGKVYLWDDLPARDRRDWSLVGVGLGVFVGSIAALQLLL